MFVVIFNFLNYTWGLLSLNLSTHAVISSGRLWTVVIPIHPPHFPGPTIKYQLLYSPSLPPALTHNLSGFLSLGLPFVFETKSHYVAQASLQFTFPLCLPGLWACILISSLYVWISQMFQCLCLSFWDLSKCCWVYCLLVPSFRLR